MDFETAKNLLQEIEWDYSLKGSTSWGEVSDRFYENVEELKDMLEELV